MRFGYRVFGSRYLGFKFVFKWQLRHDLLTHGLESEGHIECNWVVCCDLAPSETFADTQKFKPCEFEFGKVANSKPDHIRSIYHTSSIGG